MSVSQKEVRRGIKAPSTRYRARHPVLTTTKLIKCSLFQSVTEGGIQILLRLVLYKYTRILPRVLYSSACYFRVGNMVVAEQVSFAVDCVPVVDFLPAVVRLVNPKLSTWGRRVRSSVSK